MGDTVIMVNESTPRNLWPTGQIAEVFHDKQGLVCRVKVEKEDFDVGASY